MPIVEQREGSDGRARPARLFRRRPADSSLSVPVDVAAGVRADDVVVGPRTGVAVAAALLVANATNYAFQVVTGRNLSVAEYGKLAGYIAAMTVITVAASALQTTAARVVAAGELDHGGPRYLDQLTRTTFTMALIGVALATAVSPLAERVLHFGIVPTIVLGIYVLPATLDSVAAGRLQGARRFKGLGVYSASQAVGKLVAVGVGLAFGLSVTALVACIVASSMVVASIGRASSAGVGAIRAHALGRESRVAFAALTVFWLSLTMDLPLARIRLSETEAGIYAAGAVLGKAVLWLPTTVAQLVFPSLASRSGRGNDGLMRKAAWLTFLIAGLSVAALVVLGPTVYRILYGSRYDGASAIAWKIGLAMLPLAFVNLLMFERLSQRSGRFIIVLVLASVAQGAALSVVPGRPTWFAATIGIVGLASAVALAISGRRATSRSDAVDPPAGGEPSAPASA